jgi:hypothetical protein
MPEKYITIQSDTYNPIVERSTDKLLKLNELVGTGVKIDFKRVLKVDLKKIVKKHTNLKNLREL